jgi:hypothetical protein
MEEMQHLKLGFIISMYANQFPFIAHFYHPKFMHME